MVAVPFLGVRSIFNTTGGALITNVDSRWRHGYCLADMPNFRLQLFKFIKHYST